MIYVDPLMTCVPTQQWPYSQACHLFTDVGNLDELHAFAANIGMRRQWFQHGEEDRWDKIPHYDLTRGRRERAVKAGAASVTHEVTVQKLHEWREHRRPRVRFRQFEFKLMLRPTDTKRAEKFAHDKAERMGVSKDGRDWRLDCEQGKSSDGKTAYCYGSINLLVLVEPGSLCSVWELVQ